jgi:hypothetical protein
MVNSCTVCGCCTWTDIVREHLEDTLRICDVSAMGLLFIFCPSKQVTRPSPLLEWLITSTYDRLHYVQETAWNNSVPNYCQ